MKDEMGLSDQIVLKGRSDDIPLCLSAMDVYVQPSYYEGHSITILEAMGMGLPVISTRVGGTPEIIKTGENGFLFNPDDHQSMAEMIYKLYNDNALRDGMGAIAKKTVKERFSVEQMTKEYESLYAELIKEKKE